MWKSEEKDYYLTVLNSLIIESLNFEGAKAMICATNYIGGRLAIHHFENNQ